MKQRRVNTISILKKNKSCLTFRFKLSLKHVKKHF